MNHRPALTKILPTWKSLKYLQQNGNEGCGQWQFAAAAATSLKQQFELNFYGCIFHLSWLFRCTRRMTFASTPGFHGFFLVEESMTFAYSPGLLGFFPCRRKHDFCIYPWIAWLFLCRRKHDFCIHLWIRGSSLHHVSYMIGDL